MPYRHTLLCLTLLFASTTQADFNAALTAYQNQQFETAYTEFKRLAELGDAASQRNLAAMYARGEHVTKDLPEAWAWAALAAEHVPEETAIRDAVSKKLSPDGQVAATKRLEALRQLYGPTIITAKLMPVPADRAADCSITGESPAQPLKTKAPHYPSEAVNAGASGSVCVRFYLDPTGKPKRTRVYESALLGSQKETNYRKRVLKDFEQASLKALASWEFLPPENPKQRETPARYCMDYRLHDKSSDDFTVADRKTKQRLLELSQQAEAGDARAQYDFAMALDSDLQGKNAEKQKSVADMSSHFIVRSAVNGDDRGQYSLATRLLTGNQCEKDAEKGLFWLQISAQQGNAQAAWLLYQKLMSGEGVAQQETKAVEWLRIAADGGHDRARLQYALTLLEQDSNQLDAARRYLPPFEATDDLLLLEAYAKLSALLGDYIAAENYQQQVVDIATELQFQLTERRRALDAYRNKTLPTTASL